MKSGRGGSRKGAGRKTTWESGCKQEDTKPIRVPKNIADQLLKIAHRLDKGETLESDTKSKSDKVVEEIQCVLSRWRGLVNKPTSKSSHWSKACQLLCELEKILDGQLGVELVTDSNNSLEVRILDSVTKLEQSLPSTEESEATNLEMTGLFAAELASRLQTDTTAISKYKNGRHQQTLEDWSRGLDPDGFSWSYSETKRKYVISQEQSKSPIQPLSKKATDSVTKSEGRLNLVSATRKSQSSLEEVLPILPKRIAIRLGYKNHRSLSNKKGSISEVEFIEWSRKKDPDGIGWRYQGKGRKKGNGYVPADSLTKEQQENLKAWLEESGISI
ncbi:MAG: hypothetical protein F6K36_29495 [Symploca sp. SIO3C6]|nr:hypothetical protein [Symploca sp. SIO3C6]